MNSGHDACDDNDRVRPPSLSPDLIVQDSRLANGTDFVPYEYTLTPPPAFVSPDVRSPESTNSEHDPLSTADVHPSFECIGSYLLYERTSVSVAPSELTPTAEVRRAIHIDTKEEFICKIFPLNKYRDFLAPYWQAGYHPHIANIVEILLGKTQAYVFFQRSYNDLHSYIREKRRLKEYEVADLFNQIISAVKHCHKRGIVLRDLKLRKFFFADPQRSHLILEGLEDGCTLSDLNDDHLTDKHGCPAYVSPEILSSPAGYSGKSADIWSLGVILYTLLFGQYPFHAIFAKELFSKIASGSYKIPDVVSGQARCLVRRMLRKEPSERFTIQEVSKHQWFELVRSRKIGQAQLPQQPRCALAPGNTIVVVAPPQASSKPCSVVAAKETEQKVPDVAGPRPVREFGIC